MSVRCLNSIFSTTMCFFVLSAQFGAVQQEKAFLMRNVYKALQKCYKREKMFFSFGKAQSLSLWRTLRFACMQLKAKKNTIRENSILLLFYLVVPKCDSLFVWLCLNATDSSVAGRIISSHWRHWGHRALSPFRKATSR